MEDPHPTALAAMRVLLGLLWKHFGRRVAVFLSLSCLVGIVGGGGLLMLLPVLDVAGFGAGPDDPATSPSWLVELFDSFGIPFSLGAVLTACVVLVSTHAALTRWMRISKRDLERSFTKLLQDQLHRALTHAEWSFYVQTRSSDFSHALTSNLDRVSTGTFYGLNLLGSTIVALIYAGVAFVISPGMTLVSMGCLLPAWWILRRQNLVALQSGERVRDLNEEFYARISEHLAGMKEVKAFGAERRHSAAFERLTDSMVEAWRSYARSNENTSFAYTVGSALLLAVMLYLGLAIVGIRVSEAAVLVVLCARLVPRVREIHIGYQQLLNALPAFESAVELQERCESAREHTSNVESPELLRLGSAVTLRDVSYAYPSAPNVNALQNVDVTIEACKTTAIVGASGAGKTTLADVLLGLLVPTQGVVIIDGQELTGEVLAQWRRSVGYVPQATYLSHATIRENLLWAAPTATPREIRDALELAAADEFVAALPAGLDTVVGDRGARLSGGERQRIALARALLRRPTLLVLDEATSAVDSRNEARILSSLNQLQGELTVVVIAHRLSTVEAADQVLVLEAGSLLEVGSLDELTRRPEGHFRGIMQVAQAETGELPS